MIRVLDEEKEIFRQAETSQLTFKNFGQFKKERKKKKNKKKYFQWQLAQEWMVKKKQRTKYLEYILTSNRGSRIPASITRIWKNPLVLSSGSSLANNSELNHDNNINPIKVSFKAWNRNHWKNGRKVVFWKFTKNNWGKITVYLKQNIT